MIITDKIEKLIQIKENNSFSIVNISGFNGIIKLFKYLSFIFFQCILNYFFKILVDVKFKPF